MARHEIEQRGSGARAMVPAHVARVTEKVLNTYRRYVTHALECEGCQAIGGHCESGAELWRQYKEARTAAGGSR
ncbi:MULTISPECIES: hypothetical protein [Streptomyces]|uniref:Integrase n=1 Tax=Streptomyces dengpaensis TaxID=2049881 RepID=A0ABM6SVG5_9ACTN|nr:MULTISPECIES: hypothetical protein [Streptomyces]AVH58655.1 hypothetical protein C4B68_26065 [Streptomyces dengpaensis]